VPSDLRRCRGAVSGSSAIDSSVGLLDPSIGGGGCKLDNVDQSWRRVREGSIDPLDPGCRSMMQHAQPYRRTPDEIDDHRQIDAAGSQFYSSTGASENEYAYVWDRPESTADVVSSGGGPAPQKADVISSPTYPYWQQQPLRTEATVADDGVSTDPQQHYHHQQQQQHKAGTAADTVVVQHPFYQQQSQQRGYGGCGAYETTKSRTFTTLDYVGREPYCDIVNDG